MMWSFSMECWQSADFSGRWNFIACWCSFILDLRSRLVCPFVYIGQTKRDLKSRIKEHQRAIKFQRPEKSALCQHSMENDHIIDWSKVKILKVEHDYSKRLFTESWYINEKPQVLNRNDGLSFPAVYRKLLNYQCWISSGLIFPSVSSNVFCCNINSEKLFS